MIHVDRVVVEAGEHQGAFERAGEQRREGVRIGAGTDRAGRDTVVTIYVTGGGSASPPVDTGRPAPLPPPLHNLVSNIAATVGSADAVVEFAGLAPGFVGLTQVNVRIPAAAPAGEAVALRVTVGGVPTQAGTAISIR